MKLFINGLGCFILTAFFGLFMFAMAERYGLKAMFIGCGVIALLVASIAMITYKN